MAKKRRANRNKTSEATSSNVKLPRNASTVATQEPQAETSSREEYSYAKALQSNQGYPAREKLLANRILGDIERNWTTFAKIAKSNEDATAQDEFGDSLNDDSGGPPAFNNTTSAPASDLSEMPISELNQLLANLREERSQLLTENQRLRTLAKEKYGFEV